MRGGQARGGPIFIFAHLRKCAGTSVIRAAVRAGVRLPPGHVNGHLPDAAGHALGGLDRLPPDEFRGILGGLRAAGVELMAIEWDFPRFELFPTDLGLRFFTIFRDPVERLVSNYAYDVTMDYTPATSIWEWMERPAIWTRGDYFVRFFCALRAEEEVTPDHVDEAYGVLSTHFRFAFLQDDLTAFLNRDVGLPVGTLPRANKTSALRRFLRRDRLRLTRSDRERLRALNGMDYRLYDRLKSQRQRRAA